VIPDPAIAKGPANPARLPIELITAIPAAAEAPIDPVEIGDEVADDQERHQPFADFGDGSGFYGVHGRLTELDVRLTTAPST
jgi:hypothetical protein